MRVCRHGRLRKVAPIRRSFGKVLINKTGMGIELLYRFAISCIPLGTYFAFNIREEYFRLFCLETLHLRHQRVQSCYTLISTIKTNPHILKFSRATDLQFASASSATLSIASKLILENIDLPSTLNFTPQNYFEVRSLFFFNRKLSNSTRKWDNAIQDLRQRCCSGSVRCRRARQGS